MFRSRYWLNGMIPMVHTMRQLSDRVDSTLYNLTDVVATAMRTLVENQESGGYPMHQNFNLGTWNVIRSCVQQMSAQPSTVGRLLPFVLGYINASQSMLIEKGWVVRSGTTRIAGLYSGRRAGTAAFATLTGCGYCKSCSTSSAYAPPSPRHKYRWSWITWS